MSWYKEAQEVTLTEKPQRATKLPAIIDDDWWGPSDYKPSKKVSVDPPQSKSMVLTLYRGFDVDFNKLQKSGSGYVLSPAKSEQGAMWFTHRLITGYDPVKYVTGRGTHLLTYPLPVKQHYQTVHFDDGSTRNDIPAEIQAQTNTMENCRFYQGFELPDGWFFSYKHEKFIICTVPIVVTADMIRENVVDEEMTASSGGWYKLAGTLIDMVQIAAYTGFELTLIISGKRYKYVNVPGAQMIAQQIEQQKRLRNKRKSSAWMSAIIRNLNQYLIKE